MGFPNKSLIKCKIAKGIKDLFVIFSSYSGKLIGRLMRRMDVSSRLYLEVFKPSQNRRSFCFIVVIVLNLWAVVIFDQRNSSTDSKQEKNC